MSPLDGASLLLPPICLVFMYVAGKRKTGTNAGAILWAFAAGAFAIIPPGVFEFFFREIIARTHNEKEAIFPGFPITLLLVAFPEEASKFLFLRPILRRTGREKGSTFPGSGIKYGISLGLGFAFIENFLYFSTAPDTLFTRSLASLPLHAACSGMIGRAATTVAHDRNAWFFPAAIILHAVYDTLIHLNSVFSFLAPVLATGALILMVASSENAEKSGRWNL